MTLAQIGAILALLAAFGVPPATISNVETILNNAQPAVSVSSQTAPVFGSIATSSEIATPQTCNQSLTFESKKTPQVTLLEAELQANCSIDKNTQWALKDGDWHNSGDWHDYDFGTLSKGGANSWREDPNGYSIEFPANPKKSETYVLTVGDLTATTTVE